MITVIDYGVGNLFSLKSSFSYIGEEVEITGDVKKIENADKLILPGVGAFGDAIAKLKEKELDKVVLEKVNENTPVMGICLGMQLLFEKSLEFGENDGLGIIGGVVRPLGEISGKALKIPQIGWNSLNILQPHPVFKYVNQGDFVYFVHSFYGKATNSDDVISTADYGGAVTAAVAKNSVIGCQFHPEKSGKVGLGILKAFSEWRPD